MDSKTKLLMHCQNTMVWTKSEIPPLAFLIEFTQFELTVWGVVTYEQKKVG